MEVTPVEALLQEEGLSHPELNALLANESLYTVLALQPKGDIRIAPNGIQNLDRAGAYSQVGDFLRIAKASNADLVVSPEYCVPWDVLLTAIEQGCVPDPGRLWVLGCESIEFGHLDNHRTRLGDRAIVLDEPFEQNAVTTQLYRNPLVYVFRTKVLNSQAYRTVLLVQYKTVPSGDPANTEAQGMLRGTRVYLFGRQPAEVRLMTLICSDAFAFADELIQEHYDGLLLVHIQLNNNPRHARYIAYRSNLFGTREGRTELLSLNWASDITIYDESGNRIQAWNNIGGSCWYLRPAKLDCTDSGITHNHVHGIYFARQEGTRVTALLFHYKPRLFHLKATKVFHHGVIAPRSYLTGPSAIATLVWDSDAREWRPSTAAPALPDDGFKSLLASFAEESPLAGLGAAYEKTPIHAERLLTISTGTFGPESDWHSPPLVSMRFCSREVVHRVTVTLDPEAAAYRSERIAAVRAIELIGRQGFQWPPEVDFLHSGYTFHWDPVSPQTNVISSDGKYGTVIYAGHVGDPNHLQLLDKRVRHAIAGKVPPPTRRLSKEEMRAHQREHYSKILRLCILVQAGTQVIVYRNVNKEAFTQPATASALDIGVPRPRERAGATNGGEA